MHTDDDYATQQQKRIRHHAPAALTRFQHYRGGVYVFLAAALTEASLEPVVVYRCEQTDHVWVRPWSEFCGTVRLADGTTVPRYRRLD